MNESGAFCRPWIIEVTRARTHGWGGHVVPLVSTMIKRVDGLTLEGEDTDVPVRIFACSSDKLSRGSVEGALGLESCSSSFCVSVETGRS